MFSNLAKALSDTFSKPLRGAMLRSLVLAIFLLTVLGVAASYGLQAIPDIGADWGWPMLDQIIEYLSDAFLIVALVLLLMPVSALFAGLFLESVAAAVEARHYPGDAPGRDQPFVQGLVIALKFTCLLIVLNILALPLYFIPVVNLFVYWGLNGYLLGREYFELVALRHQSPEVTDKLRRTKSIRIFVAGVAAAAFASIPLLNLLTPFFATSLMVHVYKQVGQVGVKESA